MIQYLPLIVLVAACPLVIFSMRTFDQLVRLEQERYPEQWVADGRPEARFGVRSKLVRPFRSSFAAQKCNFVWLFVTPRWVREDVDARQLLRRMRILVAVWNLVAMPLFLVSALVAMAYLPG